MHRLTVEFGRLLWPVSSAQPGGCVVQQCVRVGQSRRHYTVSVCPTRCEQWSCVTVPVCGSHISPSSVPSQAWLGLPESNQLSLNCDKTEVVWCATSLQHQLPCSALSVDGTLVKPVRSARDLGIIDADLVMRTTYSEHVQRTVSRCFAVLRQLRQIRHSISADRHVPDIGWWSALC